MGADGKPRALHIPQALAVTELQPPKNHDFGGHLAQCDYFTVDAYTDDFKGTAGPESFVSLLVVDGEGEVSCGGETLPVKKGDSIFLPANSGDFAVTGTLQTLCTRV